MAGILGIVLVGVLIYQLLIAGGPTPPTATKAAGATATQTAARTGSAGGGGGAGHANTPPARLKKVDVDLDKLLKNIEVVTFIYENERTSRDPMTPLVGRILGGETRAEQTGLIPPEISIRQKSVTGIIYSDFNPVAIIDDEVVTEGHQYAGGVVITKIEPKRVWFQWRDSLIPVELKEL